MVYKMSYFFIGLIIAYACLFGYLSLASRDEAFHNAPAFTEAEPVLILSAECISNNLCRPDYLIDNDRITLQFTTKLPCQPFKDGSWYLFNPQNDSRHWVCVFFISNGLLEDQQQLFLTDLLKLLFPSFQYYGTNPSLIYFAPLSLNYSLTSSSSPDSTDTSACYLLTLYTNHKAQLLPPQEVLTESGVCKEFSVIDAAGNGPCCIRILLEDNAILLYNLVEPVSEPHSRRGIYRMHIWKEKPYVGESYRNRSRSTPRTD